MSVDQRASAIFETDGAEDAAAWAAQRRRESAAIARAVTGIHCEHYGRGASHCRTVVNHDSICVFLEDIYTPAERTLIDAGRAALVRESRHALHEAMKPRFVEAVEGVTGRRVAAFMSQVHFDPDLAVEVFVLDSDGAEG